MLKPERSWVVGEKIFKTYEEARDHVSLRRKELQLQNLIDLIVNAEAKAPTNSNGYREHIARAIIAKYALTLRK